MFSSVKHLTMPITPIATLSKKPFVYLVSVLLDLGTSVSCSCHVITSSLLWSSAHIQVKRHHGCTNPTLRPSSGNPSLCSQPNKCIHIRHPDSSLTATVAMPRTILKKGPLFNGLLNIDGEAHCQDDGYQANGYQATEFFDSKNVD